MLSRVDCTGIVLCNGTSTSFYTVFPYSVQYCNVTYESTGTFTVAVKVPGTVRYCSSAIPGTCLVILRTVTLPTVYSRLN